MSLDAQRAFLSGRMTSGKLDLPTKLPGLAFEQPVNAPYGEFWSIAGKPFPAGGSGKGKITERNVGYVQLTVWVPEGQGTIAATKAGDQFDAIFAYFIGRDKEGATYKFQGTEAIFPAVKAGWTCAVYRISYQRDQFRKIQVTAVTP